MPTLSRSDNDGVREFEASQKQLGQLVDGIGSLLAAELPPPHR